VRRAITATNPCGYWFASSLGKDVRRNALVRQVVFIEVLDEGVNNFVRDKRLARPIGSGLVPVHCEDPSELLIGIRHRSHGMCEDFSNVDADGLNVVPA
jgi:hypothetical protein